MVSTRSSNKRKSQSPTQPSLGLLGRIKKRLGTPARTQQRRARMSKSPPQPSYQNLPTLEERSRESYFANRSPPSPAEMKEIANWQNHWKGERKVRAIRAQKRGGDPSVPNAKTLGTNRSGHTPVKRLNTNTLQKLTDLPNWPLGETSMISADAADYFKSSAFSAMHISGTELSRTCMIGKPRGGGLKPTIGDGYIAGLLKSYRRKSKGKAFIVLMYGNMMSPTGKPAKLLIGFALCRVAPTFADLEKSDNLEYSRRMNLQDQKFLLRRAWRWQRLNYLAHKHSNTVNKKPIVFIDLVCGSPMFTGSTKRIMQQVIWHAKHRVGAKLVALEAVSKAASFYSIFGFQRSPNACASAKLQAMFQRNATKEYEPFRSHTMNGMYLKRANPNRVGQYLNALGNRAFAGFNDPIINQTVIMTKCIR